MNLGRAFHFLKYCAIEYLHHFIIVTETYPLDLVDHDSVNHKISDSDSLQQQCKLNARIIPLLSNHISFVHQITSYRYQDNPSLSKFYLLNYLYLTTGSRIIGRQNLASCLAFHYNNWQERLK